MTKQQSDKALDAAIALSIAFNIGEGDFDFDQPVECTEHGLIPVLDDEEFTVYFRGEFLGTQKGRSLCKAKSLLVENVATGWLSLEDL